MNVCLTLSGYYLLDTQVYLEIVIYIHFHKNCQCSPGSISFQNILVYQQDFTSGPITTTSLFGNCHIFIKIASVHLDLIIEDYLYIYSSVYVFLSE